MKVLLINGSPNRHGCTYTALSEVAGALLANGIEPEIFHIGADAIQGCTACGACYGSDGCAFDGDGVNAARQKLNEADGLIVGSPVYYASASGSLTAFLDRLFYAGVQCAHKPAAAIASARRAGTTATLDQLNKYFSINQMPIVSSQYWNMVHGNTPEQVKCDLEGLQIMRTLGNNMAYLLKCLEAGRALGITPPEREKRIATNFIR